ncbi:MAG: hypothetical protein ACD_75C00771G0005 [uncultured bacterium]|nr:MAG: hypothetical protein ACD_75C00771G0005 [uncultured bacterium]
MTSPQKAEPSEKSIRILESLKKTVSETLERKRKLGQYAVVWDGTKPVQRGDDAPPAKV